MLVLFPKISVLIKLKKKITKRKSLIFTICLFKSANALDVVVHFTSQEVMGGDGDMCSPGLVQL